MIGSLDWFKGKIMGNTHMSWEKPWFPVDFPLNQSNGWSFVGWVSVDPIPIFPIGDGGWWLWHGETR